MKKHKQTKGIVVAILLVALLPTQTIAFSFRDIQQNISNKKVELKVKMQEKTPNMSRVNHKSDSIIVRYKNDSKKFRTIKLPKGMSVNGAIKQYKKLGNVEYAEPDYIAYADMVPNDTYYNPYQWHLDNDSGSGVNAEEAWDINKGAGVTIAIIDTGVAYESARRKRVRYYKAPDLNGTCFVQGYDFINNDNYANDDEGHGTHVAGTIAQRTNNNYGVAGLAHEACIMPIKALDSNGSGSYTAIANAIYYAVNNGADVINMSLGGPASSATLENAVAYAYNNGVVILAAAGNDGNDLPHYPSSYNNYVISVGATDYATDLAYYSNYGNDVDIVAPGGDVTADLNGDGYNDGVLQQTFSAPNYRTFSYYFYQGTSMATPHASAIAAMLISNTTATNPDEVRAALESTARDLGDVGKDYYFANGLIDAKAALGWTAGPTDSPPFVMLESPAYGAEVSGLVTLLASSSDDVSVEKVEFFVDTNLIATDTTTPYEAHWDTSNSTEGVHTVKVVSTDSMGQTSEDSVNVTVDNIPDPNQPPTAFAGSDQTLVDTDGNGSEVIALDGSGSSDNDGTIVRYIWKEGSTIVATSSGVTILASVGVHTYTLTVFDNDGATDTDTTVVIIEEMPSDVEVFYDSFEVSEWNGLWNEDRQNDWRRRSQRATDGSYSAEVDGRARNAKLTSINIDLQGHSQATISFDWLIERSLDTNEYIAFYISTNGGSSWSEYARLKGNVDTENTWHSEEFTVSGSDIKLEFRGKMSSSNEDANVDNVRVIAN